MFSQEAAFTITADHISQYAAHLQEQERAKNTVKKYVHDLNDFMLFLNGKAVTKVAVIAWKEHLADTYTPATVNSMLAAVNSFFQFMDWPKLSVRPLKVQRPLFCDESREMTRTEYVRLVNAAQRQGNERLSLLLQTICATGIRVSELRFITVDAVNLGRTVVTNKGKRRTVFLPGKLCGLLKKYLKKQKITDGSVFVTRTGKPLDRSNIWRDMKALCESAGVEPDKVFPHNLRHLFARTYYSLEKDLSRLADILGHSNVSTTRIYTAESGFVHARQMERLGLILTT
ncbi:integrase [Neglecta sp. X4]|uniref:tyrosine-type recombinase/integrase n=1 Tax=unclassified Neglectibacter TaxID=2632164 RepID=UPI00136D13B9|nr:MULTISPECIES: tyrosine-type recombinase/integrase [unclassified Neglectibacter]NBI19066.1 integrase [Neglectibacter sp. 59]NBJ74751.1 integrase [Neglectibacter sp. X4]NCE82707.1 integrase [Neglectibacter sp. X58]